MWLSLETATFWHAAANVGLIAGLVLGVVSTIAIVYFAGVKEEYLTRDLAAASLSAAEANSRAAEANEKAEAERLARIKIETQLAPRLLAPEQQETITKKMGEWARLPAGDVRQSAAVFAFPASFESSTLTQQISLALKAAGWDINSYPVTFGSPITAVSGVGILTSSNPRSVAVGSALVNALTDEGIVAGLLDVRRSGCEETGVTQEYIDKNPWCSQISVFVGDHP